MKKIIKKLNSIMVEDDINYYELYVVVFYCFISAISIVLAALYFTIPNVFITLPVYLVLSVYDISCSMIYCLTPLLFVFTTILIVMEKNHNCFAKCIYCVPFVLNFVIILKELVL